MSSINYLRTAFWCRHVFRYWGISDPKELKKSLSKSNNNVRNTSITDELVKKYSDTYNKDVALDIFFDPEIDKWQSYYFGERYPQEEFISKVNRLVPKSKSYYEYGPSSLFKIFAESSPEKAVSCLKEAVEEYYAELRGETIDFEYRTIVGGSAEDPTTEIQIRKVALENIYEMSSESWQEQYKKLKKVLPPIDEFYQGHFPHSELHRLYLHIGYEAILAKFSFDDDRFTNLASLLFLNPDINIIERFEAKSNIPSSVWYNIDFIGKSKACIEAIVARCPPLE